MTEPPSISYYMSLPLPGFQHERVEMSGGMFEIFTSVKKSNVSQCHVSSQYSLNTYVTNVLFFAKKQNAWASQGA